MKAEIVLLFALATASLTAAVAAPPLAELVERAAIDAASGRVAHPDRFEVISVRLDGADAVPAGHAVLEPVAVAGPDAAGAVRIAFRVLVDDIPRGRARATVRGRVVGPALVAKTLLPRGRPLAAGAVEVVETDLTRVSEPALRTVEETARRAPLRTLGAGRVLVGSLLGPAAVVFQGDTVDLRVVRGPLVVSTLGRVRRDGAPGDVVLAENLATGAVVEGVIQADGSILVRRPGERNR